MSDSFHFLRPVMLLLIPLGMLFIVLWMRLKLKASQWQSFLPAHLHQRLVSSKGDKQSKQAFVWLMIAIVIASIGLAGPAWEKLPQPVYQTDSGRVVLMDMSLSMRATDISPSRLARAKFKAIDLIKEINDSEVGLVAYAGDAFTISPLTEDISNLENLIPSLSPEIMPSSGSNPVAGFEQAKELLESAGYQNGHIYWITDGIELEDVAPLRNLINETRYEISALTIGSNDGAPIQLQDGSLLKDNSGAIVIPKMNRDYLDQALAPSNARHTSMSIDDSDIKSMLLTSSRLDEIRAGAENQTSGDAWRDMGVYLVLLLLPIALFMFRRGLFFSLMLVLMLPLSSQDAQAQAESETTPQIPDAAVNESNQSLSHNLQSLFLNRNQKGKQAFEAGQYAAATELFDDINWQAASAYRAGDFETAAALYQQTEGLDSLYNRGNALAKMGELQLAIDEYDKVLQIAPDHAQASKNKKILEELLEQQEQQQQEQEQNEQNQQSEDGEQDQQNQDGSEGDDEQQQDGEQSEQQNSDEGEQSEQQQEDQRQSDSDQQSQQDTPESGTPQGQDEAEQEQNNEQQQAGNETEQEQGEESEQQQANVQAIDQSNLSPQEREQMQRLQTLLNKVPDDPAYLLQRKMLIEAQRRKQFAPPTTQEQEW